MKNNVLRLLLLCVFGLAFICLVLGEEKAKGVSTTDSFIRMDLLRKKTEKQKEPVRNIFMPGSRMSSGLFVDRDTEPGSSTLLGQKTATETGLSATSQSQLQGLELQYIGYVCSGEKIVALVKYMNEALAVEKNEWIDERFRVEKITCTEITILGPDSQLRVFSLEGEQQ
jgi:hypothetical protein